MKPFLSLLTIICLVVPVAGQPVDSIINDPTVAALTALLPLRDHAKFGNFLRENHKRTKFAGFLDAQGRFAVLADKEALLKAKAEADRPSYGGNAVARTRNSLWFAYIEGRALPNPMTQVTSED